MTSNIEIVNTAVFFESLEPIIKGRRWLANEIQCNSYPDPRLNQCPVVWGGDELLTLLEKHPDLQFIWGIFSSVSDSFDLESLDKKALPWADGNKAIWKKDYQPQLPNSDIEIIFFDSSEIVFSTTSDTDMTFFRKAFPQAK